MGATLGTNELVRQAKCNRKGCKGRGVGMEAEQGGSVGLLSRSASSLSRRRHPQLAAWLAKRGRGRLAVPRRHRLSQSSGLRFSSPSFWIGYWELWAPPDPARPRAARALPGLRGCLAPPVAPGWVWGLLGSGNRYILGSE